MRTVRRNVPSVVYHLISRFVDRAWFFQAAEERERYLRLLGRALQESDWVCLAYALMSSHIHLALIAGESSLESWVKRVHPAFADWMNTRHHRIGPMFVRGPKDYAVPPHLVRDVIAYIHNNPVRAGVVQRADDSAWTSHRAYVGLDAAPGWLNVAHGLTLSGLTASEFAAWVDTTPGDPCRVEIGPTRRAIRNQGAIEIATPTGGLGVIPLVRRPVGLVRPDPRWFILQAAAVVGISEQELCSQRRYRAVVCGRRLAVHVAAAFGVSGSDMAAALGITTGAVSQIRVAGLPPALQAAYEEMTRRIESVLGAKNRPSMRVYGSVS